MIHIYIFFYSFQWELIVGRQDHSFQKGLFRDRVLISPKTEKALAAAVTKLMAPMALVACGEKKTLMRNRAEDHSGTKAFLLYF